MLVETYECQETAAEPIEASEEALRIAEELGLDGQMAILSPVREDKQNSRNPYSEMNGEQHFVFSALCPKQVKLREYSRSPIPLRVLQVASHAQSLEVFDDLFVWYNDDPQEKDPVLVARFTDKVHAWMYHYYILARWGEELDAWPVLLKKAILLAKGRALAELQKIRGKVEARLALLSGATTEALIGDRTLVNTPSYNE